MTNNTVLVLRTSNADDTSYGGFQWPKSGYVKCDNWNPALHSGGGLYGYPWSKCDLSTLSSEPDALWQVVRVEWDKIVDLGDKVKFPEGLVIYSGDMAGALVHMAHDSEPYVYRSSPPVAPVINSHPRKNYSDQCYAENYAYSTFARNVSLGECAINRTAAYIGANVSFGEYARNASVGEYALNISTEVISINYATGYANKNVSAGHQALNATSGCDSINISTGTEAANASAGAYSINISTGTKSVNAARGEHSICIQTGADSIVSAGECGLLIATYWDKKSQRFRAVVGYVGEDGIEPNKRYRVRNGKFVEVEQ